MCVCTINSVPFLALHLCILHSMVNANPNMILCICKISGQRYTTCSIAARIFINRQQWWCRRTWQESHDFPVQPPWIWSIYSIFAHRNSHKNWNCWRSFPFESFLDQVLLPSLCQVHQRRIWKDPKFEYKPMCWSVSSWSTLPSLLLPLSYLLPSWEICGER